MFSTNATKHLLVVSAGIFFLTFSKWYVVSNTANPSIRPRIISSYLDWNTNWS